MVDIPSILKNAIEKSERRGRGIFDNAIKLSEEKSRTILSSLRRLAHLTRGLFRLKEKTIITLEETSKKPYVLNYIKYGILRGKRKHEILSEGFHVTAKNYNELSEAETQYLKPRSQWAETPDKHFRDIDKSIYKNLHKRFDSPEWDTYRQDPERDDDFPEIPGDRSMGTVDFHDNIPVDVKTREDRIKMLKDLSVSMETRPSPNILYVPVTEEEADEMIDSQVINREIIAFEQGITFNLETHYILAVTQNFRFEPMVSKMIRNDSYPEQLFTDEFETWLDQLNGMWTVDFLATATIMYFIDLIADNFYYKGFIRKWNKVGGGGAAIESIEVSYEKCLESTMQIEFFCDTKYRLNPGDYDTPLDTPIRSNQFTLNVESGQHLIAKKNPATNTACLQFQSGEWFEYEQTYYRAFITDENRPQSNVYMALNGCPHEITEQFIKDKLIRFDIKLPGLTGWMSMNKQFRRRGFKGTDGQGIFLSFGKVGEGILEATFGQFNTAYSGNQAILRITFPERTSPLIGLSRVAFVNWYDRYVPGATT